MLFINPVRDLFPFYMRTVQPQTGTKVRPVSNIDRATAVLSWLDCSLTAAGHYSTTWFQTSNLVQSNRTAVAENKTHTKRNGLANFY